eukprot:TRINITY_DN13267_c0_g1_i8.p1 TRINITY_DN13267_c0_g1~~TRINITY_DN13267_c0_g1_i8.p1  ORF type:complete len:237 (-),score=24.34 TRINITY_DN13267_c0_g1_i8:20-730(-)
MNSKTVPRKYRNSKSKGKFTSQQIKEAEAIVYQTLQEFNNKFYREFGLLKCLLSNPIVLAEMQRISVAGRLDLPKKNLKRSSIFLYFPNICPTFTYNPNSTTALSSFQYKQKTFTKLKLSTRTFSPMDKSKMRNGVTLLKTQGGEQSESIPRTAMLSSVLTPEQQGSKASLNVSLKGESLNAGVKDRERGSDKVRKHKCKLFWLLQFLWRGRVLSLIHICRCRRLLTCRSRWSPYH